jgi:integrase
MGQERRETAKGWKEGVEMKNETKVKGVFEKLPGSGIWWVRYADSNGRIRREKVGNKGAALTLYRKRKTEVFQGKKLPEQFRAKAVTFSELADDAIEWAKAHKLTWEDDVIRLKPLCDAFGSRTAESITAQDIERWFASNGLSRNNDRKRGQRKWKPATFNRYKALVSMVYRQGMKNGKVTVNPARQIERRKENNARDRYLTQAEEAKLRSYLAEHHPQRVPELDIALHTGMRRGEQYACEWSWVDFDRCVITVPRSKHGEKRYVYLNDTALAAFRVLWQFSQGRGKVFGHLYRADDTKGPREWFESALAAVNIKNFRWHDLRHTYASRLVMNDQNIYTVQQLLGHKTIQVTLRYAHLAPQHQLAAVQSLCDTDAAQNGATDTRTDTSDLEQAKPITASRQ